MKSNKEQPFFHPLFSRHITIALTAWILILTAYYCINAPWSSFFNWRPDTKELIVEALEFNWAPVFLSQLPLALYVLILNFIALLTGNRILRWLKVGFDSGINKVIFSITLGWSAYSIGIFYLGVSGLLYKEVVFCFLMLFGILSILEIKRFSEEWKALSKTSKLKIDKKDLVFLPVLIAFITVQFVTSFAPVVSADPLIYHLALPKLHIKHHTLVHIPGFFLSTLPAHTEMIYLLGLITSGETFSKLFSFSISTLFLVSIFSIGTKHFSKKVGYLAVFIMITIQFAFPFSSCYAEPWVDVALGLYSLLGAYALFMWIEEGKEGILYLSALCFSIAAITKIQGLFFVLLFFAGFLLTVKKDGQFFRKLKWCILAVGFISLPWYIRSWWLTGDPVFPFLYNYLGAKHWNKYSHECFKAIISQSEWRGVKSISDFFRINRELFFSSFSLLPIIGIFLVPALTLLRNGSKLIRYLFLVTLAYYIFFIFTSPQMRFFYLGFALLSIIIAYFIKKTWSKYVLTRIPIILCIVPLSVASFAVSGKWIVGPFFAGLGVIDRRAFLNEHEHGKVAEWINNHLPKDSKILSWWLDVSYGLDREYLLVNPAFQSMLDFTKIHDSHAFLKSIKALGITHLLYDTKRNVAFAPNAKEFLDKCVFELLENGKITRIKHINRYTIFSVAGK